MRFWLGTGAVLWTCCFLAGPAPGQAVSGRAAVNPAVRSAFERDGKVRVLVSLHSGQPREGKRLRIAERCEAFRRDCERFLGSLPGNGFRVCHQYRYSPSLLLDILTPRAMDVLVRSADVSAVEFDVAGTGGLVESREMIGADDVFDLGVTGEGRVVAVLDTGIDTDHPAFDGAVIYQYHIYKQGALEGPGAEDGHGHGSHVSGIIASRGGAAPRGVAPGTRIVSIKVLDNNNSGWLSDWAAGLEHVLDLHRADNGIEIDVVNMSLVSGAEFPDRCDGFVVALRMACEAIREEGIPIFACSGNTGSATEMTSPGCYSATFAVGSVRDTLPDEISTFTSRNQFLNLLAPGQSIVSAFKDGGTASMSGCSMATPHVSGLAAILLQLRPALTPEETLGVLVDTGVPVDDIASGNTFPRIDALAAVESQLSPEDCDDNGVSDTLDIARGDLVDADENGIPDICDGEHVPFQRGDANGDDRLDLSDAVTIFRRLFAAGQLACETAADADDSGVVILSDGVYILNFLFRSGLPLPLPRVGTCGIDPTEDLPCDSYPPCAA